MDDTLINACFFERRGAAEAVPEALSRLPGGGGQALVVSDRRRLLPPEQVAARFSPAELGLEAEDTGWDAVVAALCTPGAASCILVDMAWLTHRVQLALTAEAWGQAAGRIAEASGLPVVSCYNRDFLVADQLRLVFAAHRQFLAPSGLYPNPYWLPPELRAAPQAAQLSHLLGRIVPDFREGDFFDTDDSFAARGAEPDWLPRPRRIEPGQQGAEGWQVYALGQLRVYRAGGERIDWQIRGGAPRKTRTLFAYLLSQGERGARSDRLAELLWPGDEDEDTKRARLHHTVAMLRKTLGEPAVIRRSGEFYRLALPEGSWVDISSFEQLCRRGMSLRQRGQEAEALTVYRSAERLYGGALFADIPLEYLEDEQEDWGLPRRAWLMEMALKLQSHLAALLRGQGRLREALEHCQKALALDPASDEANMEAMRVFHAQGRFDAVARQYRQYRQCMEKMDASPEGKVRALYLALTSR